MPISDYYLPHLLAVLWFVICWVGYTRYAQVKGRTTPCLASVLHLYREDWMRRMLLRDNRIADANVIGNLERNASLGCGCLVRKPRVLNAGGKSPLRRPVGRAWRVGFMGKAGAGTLWPQGQRLRRWGGP